MKQKDTEPEQQQQQPQKKNPLLGKSTLIIVGVFLVLNLAFIAWFFLPKLFPAAGPDDAQTDVSALDKISMIDLGRLEITKPVDPLQQNFMRVSVTVTLTVAADRAHEVEPRIKKFEALFKEQARRAFLDADQSDIAGENLAGVKNTIKTRINETLGEDAVKDVIFGDFRPY